MTSVRRPPHGARAAGATTPRSGDAPSTSTPTRPTPSERDQPLSAPAGQATEPDRDEPVGPAARMLIAIVRAYQRWISPMLAPRCRFYPSCSAYAVTALARHGAIRGSALALWRVLRCQPFHPGGVDPVPPRRASDRPRVAKTR
jgi:uncharacterized protein